MAEFGENLKNVREQKGYTQQTLADHLYVTRQAVSRWEGGSRYPDLMTAKKMAQFLEVSLDELLTDDDMKLYAEKNAIIENSTAKRGQLLLLGLTFMSMLILSIIHLTGFTLGYDDYLIYSSASPTYFLLTVLLGISVFSALFDRLNAKMALIIYSGYFGFSLLTGIISVVFTQKIDLFSLKGIVFWGFFAGSILLNLWCLFLCIRVFAGKRPVTPKSLYIANGIYGAVTLISSIPGLCSAISSRNTYLFVDSALSLLAHLTLLTLLIAIVYTLHRKRKLSAK